MIPVSRFSWFLNWGTAFLRHFTCVVLVSGVCHCLFVCLFVSKPFISSGRDLEIRTSNRELFFGEYERKSLVYLFFRRVGTEESFAPANIAMDHHYDKCPVVSYYYLHYFFTLWGSCRYTRLLFRPFIPGMSEVSHQPICRHRKFRWEWKSLEMCM